MQRSLGVTLAQLEAFVAVVDHGSFTAAAAALGRAQPTVSKEVGALERRARTELLRRGRTGSTPTDAGREAAELARTVLEAALRLDQALDARRSAPTSPGTPLTLACSPSVANRFLPRLLRALDASGDAPSVTLREVGTGEVEGLVADGRADLGLCHLARRLPGTTVQAIGSDPLVLVGASATLARAASPDDLSGLADVPLLAWSRHAHPEYLDLLLRVCRERGLEARTVGGTDRVSGARRYLLAEGRAVALVPADATEALREDLASTPLPGASVPLCAVTRQGPERTVRDVVALARRLAREGGG